jgi:F-type H+-transporting ATPase subunit a
MPEHELWITALLNRYLAGAANTVLSLLRVHVEEPAKPWANFVAMQVLVALIFIILFAILRPRLSMDRPGRMQHLLEAVYDFLRGKSDDVVGHSGKKYLHFFGTIFLFILFSNLIGLIPTLESPTMFTPVPLGCALVAFCYYNIMGLKAQGVFGYMKHFAGPMPALAPIMVPIEIFSHAGRLLSLTARLYANMFAGEQVTGAFLGLTKVVAPAIFMAQHVFVAILQAYIFMLLSMIYVSLATSHEH